jgi:hypothetical protein
VDFREARINFLKPDLEYLRETIKNFLKPDLDFREEWNKGLNVATFILIADFLLIIFWLCLIPTK